MIENLAIQEPTCNSFELIPHCAKYDKNRRLVESTLDCLYCEADYFLNNNTCVKRTIIASCSTLNLKADECVKCGDKYYLSKDKKSCKLLENGVPGCIEYYTKTDCRKCNKNLYLHNNYCAPVPPINLIDNCDYYQDAYTCSSCSGEFIL